VEELDMVIEIARENKIGENDNEDIRFSLGAFEC
jgi:hypothetical protein